MSKNINDFEQFAEQWVNARLDGQVWRASFARFEDAAKKTGATMSEDVAAKLFEEYAGKSAFVDVPGLSKHDLRCVGDYIAEASKRFNKKPQVVADLIGCKWQTDGALHEPNGSLLHNVADNRPLRYFKQLLKAAAKAGIVEQQIVTICGRPAIYLYSL